MGKINRSEEFLKHPDLFILDHHQAVQGLKLLFLFVLSFLYCSLHAQVLPHEKYTSRHGLISDRITAITQDEQGFMWFGSYFGVCRYNGIRFEKIRLSPQQENKYVNCLLAAQQKVYAGFLFNGGLAEYHNGEVKAHFIRGKDSAISNAFTHMCKDPGGGILLINQSAQVYRFRNSQFELLYTIPRPKGDITVSALQTDTLGNIWIGLSNGLLILPPPYRKARAYYPGQLVFSLSVDKHERIWLNRYDGKVSVVELSGANKYGDLEKSQILHHSADIRRASFSGNGIDESWVIDYNHGLGRVIPGKPASYFRIPMDFSTDLNLVYADREHNLWIANEPGVIKVNNFSNETFHFGEIAAGGGDIIAINDSAHWITNAKSLYLGSPKQLTKKDLGVPLKNYFGMLLFDRDKNLWTGLWNHGLWLTRWEKGLLKEKKFYGEYKGRQVTVTSMTTDHSGNIFAGGYNGVFLIRNKKILQQLHPLNANRTPAAISSMALDPNNQSL